MQISRLTTSGDVEMTAISPDGKYVAYVTAAKGQHALWMRQVGTDSHVQIVPPSDQTYRGVAFSPDGNFVYYSRRDAAQGDWILNRVATLGGASEQIAVDVDSAVTFSPDNSRLAFVRLNGDMSSIVAANADGQNVQVLSTARVPELLDRAGPAWSPDGKSIAVSALVTSGKWHTELLQAPAAGGNFTIAKSPQTPDWFSIGQIAWLPDASGLLAVVDASPNHALELGQIWNLSYPDGNARRITNDLNDYSGVSLSRDGKSLVTVQQQEAGSIWIGTSGDSKELRNVSAASENIDGEDGLDWAPDGKIVYASAEGGTYEMWRMDSDGGNRRQLTSAPPNSSPRVTPDGRTIIFFSGRNGAADIWSMNMDGTDERQLTKNGSVARFDISPDGKSLFYVATVAGKSVLFRQQIQGGEPVQLAALFAQSVPLAASPDGKWVAVPALIESGSATQRIVVRLVPLDGGNAMNVETPFITFDTMNSGFRWSVDSKNLILTRPENGATNLWLVPIDGSPPKQWTHFTSEDIFKFALSRDGQRLAVSRGTVSRNAILIRNF